MSGSGADMKLIPGPWNSTTRTIKIDHDAQPDAHTARTTTASAASERGAREEVVNRDEIVALDKAHVWHPYTAMRVYLEEVDPLVVVRAEGSHLFDASGKQYIDGNSSWWTATLGHRHPRIIAAAKKQMDSLDHCALAGIAHEQASALAAELCDSRPG